VWCRKREKAVQILAPMTVKDRDAPDRADAPGGGARFFPPSRSSTSADRSLLQVIAAERLRDAGDPSQASMSPRFHPSSELRTTSTFCLEIETASA
jgi:hypothetical protein